MASLVGWNMEPKAAPNEVEIPVGLLGKTYLLIPYVFQKRTKNTCSNEALRIAFVSRAPASLRTL